jgi:Cof subfamily protein (haloacid dehalogenase superfamily)
VTHLDPKTFLNLPAAVTPRLSRVRRSIANLAGPAASWLAELLKPRQTPVRLVALDLDGTLLDSNKRISGRTVKAIRLMPELGVRVAIASARPPRSCRAIYDGLGLDTWQVNYNGALLWDPPGGRPVRHWPMQGELVWKMVNLARQEVPGVQVAAEVVDRWYTDKHDPYRTTVTGKLFRPDVVAPLAAWGKQSTTKLMFLAEPRKVAKVREALRREFGSQANVVHADPDLVQVMDRTAGKDVALAHVAQHHGIDRAETMAVGDALNDLEMLQWAAVPVAMKNGCEDCRRIANWVAPTNDDDGVYQALLKFVPQARERLSQAA